MIIYHMILRYISGFGGPDGSVGEHQSEELPVGVAVGHLAGRIGDSVWVETARSEQFEVAEPGVPV